MNIVSGMNIHLIGTIVCVICVFYTLVGGMKAIVYTDAWQIIIVFISVVVVVVIGTWKQSGFDYIFEKAAEGGRIKFFK